jgi:hypothetical protein
MSKSCSTPVYEAVHKVKGDEGWVEMEGVEA